MKKRVIIFGMILFMLVLKVNVYGIENNNIITENIDMIENNNITTENINTIEKNNIIKENIDTLEENVKQTENEIKKQNKESIVVSSGIEKIKENGIYKIATSQNISKSIEIPGGNEANNIQLGIWDYR